MRAVDFFFLAICFTKTTFHDGFKGRRMTFGTWWKWWGWSRDGRIWRNWIRQWIHRGRFTFLLVKITTQVYVLASHGQISHWTVWIFALLTVFWTFAIFSVVIVCITSYLIIFGLWSELFIASWSFIVKFLGIIKFNTRYFWCVWINTILACEIRTTYFCNCSWA